MYLFIEIDPTVLIAVVFVVFVVFVAFVAFVALADLAEMIDWIDWKSWINCFTAFVTITWNRLALLLLHKQLIILALQIYPFAILFQVGQNWLTWNTNPLRSAIKQG